MATNAQRKAATRAKIVNMATQLYIRNGVKETSIADIAKAADISQVTLYKYFDSKQTLSSQVVIQLIDEGYEQDAKIVEDPDRTFLEKMRLLMNQSTSMTAGMNPDFFDFVTAELAGKNGSTDAMAAYEAGKNHFWTELLQQGREAGEISSEISNAAVMAYLDMFVSYFVSLSQSEAPAVQARMKSLGAELDRLFFYGLIGKE